MPKEAVRLLPSREQFVRLLAHARAEPCPEEALQTPYLPLHTRAGRGACPAPSRFLRAAFCLRDFPASAGSFPLARSGERI